MAPVPQDAIQADQHATLTLRVRRGEAGHDITFLPRGAAAPAWLWRRSGDAAGDLE
ncbi:MAG: hypothetical protein LAT81_14070 [Oceanicaulis sp.]|nr:hypothetical protein [Oceanicaulis sp.]